MAKVNKTDLTLIGMEALTFFETLEVHDDIGANKFKVVKVPNGWLVSPINNLGQPEGVAFVPEK